MHLKYNAFPVRMKSFVCSSSLVTFYFFFLFAPPFFLLVCDFLLVYIILYI